MFYQIQLEPGNGYAGYAAAATLEPGNGYAGYAAAATLEPGNGYAGYAAAATLEPGNGYAGYALNASSLDCFGLIEMAIALAAERAITVPKTTQLIFNELRFMCLLQICGIKFCRARVPQMGHLRYHKSNQLCNFSLNVKK